MSAITPSSTASNSIVALSVSISAITSPALTLSPTLTSQRESVPSSMVGDSAGIRIAIDMAGGFVLPGVIRSRLWPIWRAGASRLHEMGFPR